ncbi:MAG: serine hydrolase domain-containing protein [Actinomycetota bacterium]
MPAKTKARIHQKLDRFVKSEMKRTGVPGVEVGLLHRGSRYVQGYGVTSVDHPLPVTADTLFQIGSTTKTFTATAVMRLVEQGKLELNVPLRRYLPDLRLKNKEAERKATLLNLLTHTGGWLGDYFEGGGRGDDALAQVVAKMSKIKQLTPLGQVWSYSNSGFYLAGRVLEKVLRKPYETAIRELLFEPLGMENSFFFAEEVLPFRVAVGHITRGKKSSVARPWALRRSAAPAGGIISNAMDQLTWAAFNMGDGRAPSGKRVLRKGTLRLMQKPHAPAGSMADAVGLSWLLRTGGDERVVAHGGTTNGQLSAFSMVPDRQFAITVLTNSTRGGELHQAVVRWAFEHYLGIEQPEVPKLRVRSEELESYAGKYVVEASGQSFDLTARNGRLVVQLPTPPPAPDGRKPPVLPPVPLHFIAPDRVMAFSGRMKGSRGEFVRSPSGRIQWFRLGGRIHRRVEPARARKTK